MDDNRYPPPEAPPPELSLERQITVGHTQFLITATGAPDTRIDLAVVGCDRDGRVLSEISGGISRGELPAMAEVLTSTLAGLVALHTQHHRVTARRRRAANHGARWSPGDDERLLARHREGASRRELSDEFGRSPAGIRARLEHLGEVDRPERPTTPR
ncbi:hypothetical protein AB0M54_15185 [Actinoplanes sp. NPDC051470]|uniref:hypothetical protein n=1 Tax=unclassified Actinoplanes TaxID=2626549 RepID=UPI0034191D26